MQKNREEDVLFNNEPVHVVPTCGRKGNVEPDMKSSLFFRYTHQTKYIENKNEREPIFCLHNRDV